MESQGERGRREGGGNAMTRSLGHVTVASPRSNSLFPTVTHARGGCGHAPPIFETHYFPLARSVRRCRHGCTDVGRLSLAAHMERSREQLGSTCRPVSPSADRGRRSWHATRPVLQWAAASSPGKPMPIPPRPPSSSRPRLVFLPTGKALSRPGMRRDVEQRRGPPFDALEPSEPVFSCR